MLALLLIPRDIYIRCFHSYYVYGGDMEESYREGMETNIKLFLMIMARRESYLVPAAVSQEIYLVKGIHPVTSMT